MKTSIKYRVAAGLAALSVMVAGSAAMAGGAKAEDAQNTEVTENAEQDFSFGTLSGQIFEFSSGAGGWSTELTIAPDGSFTGSFHDGELGETGDDYPNGTVYGCTFHGRLSAEESDNDYTWNLKIDSLELDEGQVTEAIEDGVRYVTATPYGLENTDELLLYLPGAPMAQLPEEFREWASYHGIGEDTVELPCYGLYNAAEADGFTSYDLNEDGSEAEAMEPVHQLDMETYGSEDSTVAASFTSDAIDENNVLSYSIYDTDLYETEKVLALQPGDRIWVNGELLTISSVEQADGSIEINGGYLNESEEGASLWYVDGDPDHLRSVTYFDEESMTMIGQAAYQLADQVTVRSYRLNAEECFEGEYDEVTMPASEVKAYLAGLEAGGVVFSYENTRLTMTNGQISEIFVDWTPAA